MEAYGSPDDWESIGSGAYGKVYKAKVNGTEEVVAIKRIDPDVDDIVGLHPDVIREITLLRRINPHPHIIGFHDAFPVMAEGKKNPTMFLVFDCLDKTLAQLVNQIGFQDDIREFLQHILSGVDHCHSFSVLHRDLKPDNILFDEKNRTLKIADFGSGRGFTVGPEGSNYSPEVLAAIEWKAPEVLLLTGKYSSPVDIWSVGLIFALMARGGKKLISGADRFTQLIGIFQLLGIPTEEEWPGVTKALGWPIDEQWEVVMANCKDYTSEEFRLSSLRAAVPSLDSDGFDLLSQMLTYNPRKRITAKEALDHVYFKKHDKAQA